MPDHVHLLISEPAKGTPSVILKVLKQRVSRDLRRKKHRASAGQLRLAFLRTGEDLPRFWQPRFFDFNVWSQKKDQGEAGLYAPQSHEAENSSNIPRTGRGAVGRSTPKEKRDC